MKNFIDLSYDEKLMVLKWRNDIRIRKKMHSSSIISLDNHLNFINNLSNDKEKKYFLIDDIGVIYFNNIKNNTAELGLYSNPEKYRVGKILLEEILSFDYDYFYLEVMEDNKKAIDLYTKYKFKKTDQKSINGKTIIYMEYKNNENR